MFDKDNLLGGLIQAAFLGLAYGLGKHHAEVKMHEDIKEFCKEQELNDLKRQVAELKRLNNIG